MGVTRDSVWRFTDFLREHLADVSDYAHPVFNRAWLVSTALFTFVFGDDISGEPGAAEVLAESLDAFCRVAADDGFTGPAPRALACWPSDRDRPSDSRRATDALATAKGIWERSGEGLEVRHSWRTAWWSGPGWSTSTG